MNTKLLTTISLLALTTICKSNAQSFIIEPDNYTNGAVLDHIFSQVSLTTAGADNLPIPPVSFNVTASFDGFGYASTGTNVFGHAGVPFWNTDRRLRMDFNVPANFISIDFIGGEFFTNEVAELDAFNSAGTLLASYISGPRGSDSVETMFLSRPAGDIAWAVAYLPPGDGVFGRLDNLQFGVVPEPSVVTIIFAGGAALFGRQRLACKHRKN
jgi:hypothetical protein